tara:strand:- start:124 stop:441 length:318 start_codon:yes stop_codon:yes gene_type:complete
MTWLSVTISGLITYFTRMAMVTLVDREMLGEKTKKVLTYVPSAVFPAIIFPGVFLNDLGYFVELNDPKIFGAFIALIVGYFSKNVIATIVSGLLSYWFIIFFLLK